jgi:co-chaperonin GroES (HSP10)
MILPTKGWVYVRRDVPASFAGIILLPDTAKVPCQHGQVLRAPEGSCVKKGDWVIYTRQAEVPYEVEDKDGVILSEDELMAVVDVEALT